VRTYQNIAKVLLSCLLMFAIAFTLISAHSTQISNDSTQSGSSPVVQVLLPVAGQVIHAHYRLTRAIDPGGTPNGWGAANQNTEAWWLVGQNQIILQIYNRVTDDQSNLISEVFYDGKGKVFQYWNQRDELWIDPDSDSHMIAAWSPDVIDKELTAKGFNPTVQSQIAGHQTLIMERQSTDKPPADWLPQIPGPFQDGKLVRRVFVGQAPIRGFQVGFEDVFSNQSGAEFVIQSYRLVSWEILGSASQVGNVFSWQPPAAKTVRDATKSK
jgi:hypothetical protein